METMRTKIVQTVPWEKGPGNLNSDFRCYPVDVADWFLGAAEDACRELASARAYLDGTLLEGQGSLRAQIQITLKQLQKALHECRDG